MASPQFDFVVLLLFSSSFSSSLASVDETLRKHVGKGKDLHPNASLEISSIYRLYCVKNVFILCMVMAKVKHEELKFWIN